MMKLLKNIFDVVIALIKLIYTLIYALIYFYFLSFFSGDETEEKIEYTNYNKEKKVYQDIYNYLKELKETNPEQFKTEYRYYIATGHIPEGVEFK